MNARSFFLLFGVSVFLSLHSSHAQVKDLEEGLRKNPSQALPIIQSLVSQIKAEKADSPDYEPIYAVLRKLPISDVIAVAQLAKQTLRDSLQKYGALQEMEETGDFTARLSGGGQVWGAFSFIYGSGRGSGYATGSTHTRTKRVNEVYVFTVQIPSTVEKYRKLVSDFDALPTLPEGTITPYVTRMLVETARKDVADFDRSSDSLLFEQILPQRNALAALIHYIEILPAKKFEVSAGDDVSASALKADFEKIEAWANETKIIVNVQQRQIDFDQFEVVDLHSRTELNMWCNPNFCGEYKLAGRALLATTTVPGETRRLAWVNYAARSEREAAADGKKMCSVDIRMSDSGAIQYQNRSILSPPIFIPNSSRYVDETRYVLRSPEISAAWLEEDHCFRFKNYFRPQGRFFGFVY